jgi:hypothetical protein
LCQSANLHTNAIAKTLSEMSKESFYSTFLGWDPEIWNFTNVDLTINVNPKLNQK